MDTVAFLAELKSDPELRSQLAAALGPELEDQGLLFRPSVNMRKAAAAAERVKQWLLGTVEYPETPLGFAVILGSGLSGVLDSFKVVAQLPYEHIPHLGRSGAPGHVSCMYLVKAGETYGLIFSGRRHWYEGEGWTAPAIPPYIARSLGIPLWVTTTACGGIRQDVQLPGTLALVDDFVGAFPFDPMFGLVPGNFGDCKFWNRQTFRDKANEHQRSLFRTAAKQESVTIADVGCCYGFEPGPDYEPIARIRQLLPTVDVVGMSGVESLYFARGVDYSKDPRNGRILHLAMVTNPAAGMKPTGITSVPDEAEVLREAALLAQGIGRALTRYLSSAAA